MNQKYLIDTKVISVALKTYYSPEYGPEFWNWLYEANRAGIVFSIDIVYGEMQHDSEETRELAAWSAEFNERTAGMFFLSTDDVRTRKIVQKLIGWSQAKKQYTDEAREEFRAATNADIRLIAYAKAHGYTVVTSEVSAPESKKSIKIPDACMAHDVPFANIFQMLTSERFKFAENRAT